MSCINLRIRTKDYKKYIYCLKKKRQIQYKDCVNCKYKTYKQVKELKKKSKKQKKLEDKRFSIITSNLDVCYICNKRRKEDLHEIFGGSNRNTSMKWGLVIPVCRICHDKLDTDEKVRAEIQIKAQEKFEKDYSHELFMTEFKKNYIEKWRIRK